MYCIIYCFANSIYSVLPQRVFIFHSQLEFEIIANNIIDTADIYVILSLYVTES